MKKCTKICCICIILLLSGCFGNDNNDSTRIVTSNGGSLERMIELLGSIDTSDDPHCITPNGFSFKPLRCLTPQDIHKAYHLDDLYDMGLTGEGITIVLLDVYGNDTAEVDLQTFHDAYFPGTENTASFEQIKIGDPTKTRSWSDEVSLDVQWAHAIAPGADIHLILTDLDVSDEDTIAALQYIVDSYEAGTLVSMSWGASETAYSDEARAAMEEIFEAGINKGITFFASSGDGGSTNYEDYLALEYPASSPYVTAVGGTYLQMDWTWDPTSTRFYLNMSDYFNVIENEGQQTEMVWSEAWIQALFGLGTTGGGVSDVFAMPDWQSSSVYDIISTNGKGKLGRATPDIAWHAAFHSSVLIYNSGSWEPGGGTSSSSPQIAGFFALINQYLYQQDMDYVRYLNPLLYQLDASAFNDIQSHEVGNVFLGELTSNQAFVYDHSFEALVFGNNFSFNDIEGYPVDEGWDMATGFGSPRSKDFLNALVTAISARDNSEE